jgi:hypothetical protein
MELVNINRRLVYKSNCSVCGKQIIIQKSKICNHKGKCNSCSTIERNISNRGNYKHSHNKDYFALQSLQSAYWAGFIAADGCVSDRNAIAIKIKETDIETLERFIEDTDFSGKVLNSGTEDRKRVVLTSHEWAESLSTIYNIGPRKSLTLTPPSTLSQQNKLAYIIGYIDGDGTIGYIGKNKYFRLGMVGTYDFLTWVKSVFDEIITPTKAKGINAIGSVFNLTVYGKRGFEVYHMLKCVPVTKMPRKWTID